MALGFVSPSSEIISGTLTGAQELRVDVRGLTTVVVEVSSYSLAGLVVETSMDGSLWQIASGFDLLLLDGQPTYILFNDGAWQVNVAGWNYFRVNNTAGSAHIVIGTNLGPGVITAIASYVFTRGTANLQDGAGNPITSTVIGASRALDVAAQGNVASGATDTGNPVKIGAVFNTTLPTVTNGQRVDLQADNRGRLIIVASNLPATVDTNYGVVGASTLRTAAQIGNSTGAADFNAGVTGAQTLRVTANQGGTWILGANSGVDIGDVTINNAAGAAAVNIQDGGNSITVDGTVSASNFPTTVDTNYGTVGANTLRGAAQIGNATGAALFGAGTTTAQVLRVVLPTDQTVIPVQGQKTNNNAAPGATNLGVLPGIATAAIQTWTEGNQVALSTDLSGRTRVLNTPTLGILQTYSASATNLLSAASATDIFTITGSATKTIYITLMTISGTSTAVATSTVNIIKRSTADTGGTSANVVEIPHDSTNAAATATVLSYTANPTLGTAVGTVRSFKVFTSTATGGNASSPSIPTLYPQTFAQPIVLRGTGEVIAFNLNGVTIGGGSWGISIEWVEV